MNNPMVMKAVGAMMRGEDPKTFMRNLASTNPQLQGFDLNDLEGTAKALCEKNNVSMTELASQIQDFAKSNIK
jgi:hypothetical protein